MKKFLFEHVGGNVFRLTEEVKGEWWIDKGGSAVYADGDIGDMNHEMHIEGLLLYEIYNALDIDTGDVEGNPPRCHDYADDIYEQIGETFTNEEKLAWEEGEIDKVLINILKRKGFKDAVEKYTIANGGGDAREYGIAKMGWKRMVRNNIETQTLTSQDLEAISSGIYDAYHYDLENDENQTFNIEVRSNSTEYSKVPWKVIEQGNIMKLMPYRARYDRMSPDLFQLPNDV